MKVRYGAPVAYTASGIPLTTMSNAPTNRTLDAGAGGVYVAPLPMCGEPPPDRPEHVTRTPDGLYAVVSEDMFRVVDRADLLPEPAAVTEGEARGE